MPLKLDDSTDSSLSTFSTNTSYSLSPLSPSPTNKHEPTQTFAQQYELQHRIGSGHFATVYQCIERSTGRVYAVKCVDKSTSEGASHRYSHSCSLLYREASVLSSLRHKNILEMQNVLSDGEDGGKKYMVIVLASEGSLYDRLVMTKKLTEHDSQIVFEQLCEGLDYLHKRGLIHRDIKPENILFTDKHLTLKICDFGLSQGAFSSCPSRLYGTPSYMAPEVYTNDTSRQYTPAVDVWSAGVVLYICLCGFPPFSDEYYTERFPYNLQQQIALGSFDYPSPYWDFISTDALVLIDSMLIVKPKHRITIPDCLSHKWLARETCDKQSGKETIQDEAEARHG